MTGFLVVLAALELGVVTDNGWWLYAEPAPAITEQNSYYTDLEVEAVAWEILFARANVRTDVFPHALDNWDPFWMSYTVTLGIRAGPVELAWRRFCMHPIQTYLRGAAGRTPLLEGAFSEVYLRISSWR